MRQVATLAVSLFVLAGLVALAQEQPPLDVDKEERVEVNLVIVDAVVLDRNGRTVGDLTRDDFRLSVRGRAREIDTFDVVCPEGGQDDPVAITLEESRPPVGPEPNRRIVLAFDYYTLTRPNRVASLEWGQVIAARDMAAGDGIMIVALADGLRIEQRFTGNQREVYYALERMKNDVSLYGRDFGTLTPRSALDNLGLLADVLAQYPGPKTVVLFSEWGDRADQWDLDFRQAAERAAAARTSFYPVWAQGLQAGGVTGGSPALARLANESGGRFTRNVNDLSMGYVRARQALACRYAIGFYVDPEDAGKGRTVTVRVEKSGLEVRAPERTRQLNEEQLLESRLRAAFADPGPSDDPLVRAFAYPFRPMSGNSWEVLLGFSFPLWIGEEGATRELGASLTRGHLGITAGTMPFEFTPPRSGEPGVKQVSVYGVRKLKTGSHELTVAVADPATDRIKTSRVEFVVPEVPEGLIVRGPVLVRVDPDAVRIRVDKKEAKDSELDELIGDAGFVPLLVTQVAPEDELVAAWEICAVKTGGPKDATVERRILSGDEVVHRLDPSPLALEGKKKLSCQSRLERIPGGTLEEGRYRFEVAVVAGGEDKALGTRPFSITRPPE